MLDDRANEQIRITTIAQIFFVFFNVPLSFLRVPSHPILLVTGLRGELALAPAVELR
jgi:hypothetical protein